jgi:DNA-binding XRE family transcriptional regulator
VTRGIRVPQLRRIRREQAYSQDELAELAQVGRTTIWRGELGRGLRRGRVRLIARALKTTIAALSAEDDA